MKRPRSESGVAPWQLALIAAMLLIGLFLARPAENLTAVTPTAAPTAFPAQRGLRVAVASDLHFDPMNTDRSGEISEVLYSPELAEALLWDARQQGASLLLLTGDLVNGGSAARHEALAGMLRQAEETGLEVYVLPGNHDLAPVGQRDFAAFYGEFGYDEAWSRDRASLSYCVLREDLALLMLDCGGYSAGAIDLPEAPKREETAAFFTEESLRWAEEMLREARARKLPILCAGHYNLLSPISNSEDGRYHVENGERMAALLRDYGVMLYLSGHVHVRAVYEEAGLTELVTEYLLGYPTGYSVLDLAASALRYTPRRIDVDAWAAQSGQKDPVLLRFSDWQQEELRRYSHSNVQYMARRNPLREGEEELAAEFFYEVMDAFWRGDLAAKRDSLEAMPGCAAFFRCAEGFSYGWWLRDLLDTASPEMKGFTLSRGTA